MDHLKHAYVSATRTYRWPIEALIDTIDRLRGYPSDIDAELILLSTLLSVTHRDSASSPGQIVRYGAEQGNRNQDLPTSATP